MGVHANESVVYLVAINSLKAEAWIYVQHMVAELNVKLLVVKKGDLVRAFVGVTGEADAVE